MSLAKFCVVLVCTQVTENFKTQQNNDVFYGWFVSETEALGVAIQLAAKKHPGGTVVFQMVNDATQDVRDEPK